MRNRINRLFLTTLFVANCFAAKSQEMENKWMYLIKAIGNVESRGNPNAVNGKFVGILQISPVVIDDCNRINKLYNKKKRYHYNDRYSIEKSIEIFHLIQGYYNVTDNEEVAIRLWNGGSGWKKNPRKTDTYYKKVMAELKRLNQEID